MHSTVWKSLLIAVFAFACIATGQERISLPQILSGVYNYVSVQQILRLPPEDPFFLALVCPERVIVNESNSQNVVNITLLSHSETASRCSFGSNGSASSVQVAFQLLSLDTSAANDSDQQTIPLSELTNHFPLLSGEVMHAQLLCPLLNVSISNARIRAQDMGFFYSLINHYRSSGAELGTEFAAIQSSSLARVEQSFSLKFFLDNAGTGCSYLKEGDEETLRGEVLKLLETAATATPEAQIAASETPSATANKTDDDGEKACFPAAAKVKLSNGSLVPMSELAVGDEILSGDGSFSKVLMFTHADDNIRWQFVRLATRRGSVVASRSHYVYANGALKTAGSVRPGDVLSVHAQHGGAEASAEKVLRTETLRARGLFNPHTQSGTLVVFWDGHGVRCSAYTASVSPPLAHALLAPFRWLAPLLPKVTQ